MRRRTVLTGLVIWTLVVVAVSAVTWAVIDAAGQDLLAGGDLVTDAAPAVTRTEDSSPGASPSAERSRGGRPSATSSPRQATATPSRTASEPAVDPRPREIPVPESRTRTWEGVPGTVSVRCQGTQISLASASPNNGYRIEVDRGGQEIEVHFKSSTREYQLKARCSGGTPTFRVESEGGEGKDD